MSKLKITDISPDLNSEEIAELKRAEEKPLFFDKDSPEMTPEMLEQFKRASRNERNKQIVSLRLPPETVKKAKSYGNGYTAFLSRLIVEALKDEDLVRRCI